MPASINQMLSGGTIISTCILSKYMLKREICRHHAAGVGFAIIGFVLVGVASLLNGDSVGQYGSGSLITGVLMVTGSLFTQGLQTNLEEKILNEWQIDCQRMVGLEGFFGLVWIFMWIMIASYVPCPNQNMCDVYGYMDDPIAGVNQIFADWHVLMWSFVIIFSILFFNLNGIILTKQVSCVFRAFWDATRTVTVWLLSVILGLETLDWVSSPIQLLGFVFLVLGNLTYNETIEWKCCGMNKYMSKYDVKLRRKSVATRSFLDRQAPVNAGDRLQERISEESMGIQDGTSGDKTEMES